MKKVIKGKMIKNVRQIERSKMTTIQYLKWIYQELNHQEGVKSLIKSLAEK